MVQTLGELGRRLAGVVEGYEQVVDGLFVHKAAQFGVQTAAAGHVEEHAAGVKREAQP